MITASKLPDSIHRVRYHLPSGSHKFYERFPHRAVMLWLPNPQRKPLSSYYAMFSEKNKKTAGKPSFYF